MVVAAPQIQAPDQVRAPRVTRARHLSLVGSAPEPEGAGREGAPGPNGQELLDLMFELPCGLPATPLPPDDVHTPAPRRWVYGIEPSESTPTPRTALPPPGAWAARLAQAVLEVCSAGRPLTQLLRWTTPEVFEALQSRYVPRAKRDVTRRRVAVTEKVSSVHVCEPADGVAEVSVLVKGGERPHAMALRIEGWRGRWICTTLDWV